MKSIIKIVNVLEKFSDTGVKGKCVQKFFSGLLKLIHPRAKMIENNLKLVYPESNYKWRKNLRSAIYYNLSWTLTEILALQKNPAQAFEWVKHVENLNYVDELLSKKHGVIFLTGHIGNWELLGAWYAQYAKSHGHELHIIHQEIHDKDIWHYVNDSRIKYGIKSLPKEISVLSLARLLKNGAHIAILNDISGYADMIAPFLGHDCTNTPGPAILSMLSGAPILPVCIYRNKPFEHEIKVLEPLKIPDKNLKYEDRVKKMISEWNEAYAKMILARPELWFWLHNRWKNKK